MSQLEMTTNEDQLHALLEDAARTAEEREKAEVPPGGTATCTTGSTFMSFVFIIVSANSSTSLINYFFQISQMEIEIEQLKTQLEIEKEVFVHFSVFGGQAKISRCSPPFFTLSRLLFCLAFSLRSFETCVPVLF